MLVTTSCDSNSWIVIVITLTVGIAAIAVTCAALWVLCHKRKTRKEERKSAIHGALSLESTRASFNSMIHSDSREKQEFKNFLRKDRSMHYLQVQIR